MAQDGGKSFIELPLKFVFTEEGSSSLMNQNVRINRLKMGDQTEDYGVFVDKISPVFLQRMITAGYISKIEVSGVEVVESRGDIAELSKLIVRSILYRSYAELSLEKVLGADPVKQWNHSNPSLVIDEKTRFRDGMVESFIERHEEELTAIRRDLLEPIYRNIDGDESLSPEEQEARRDILSDYLASASPLTLFVILKFRKTREFPYLVRDLRLNLAEFLGKANIVEYAALMLLELASNIENLNIQKEARLLYKTSRVDLKTLLMDPHLRLPVIESLRRKNRLLTFSWKLGTGKRGRFQVLLYDQDINYEETRGNFEAAGNADVSRFNLSEFYKKLHKSGDDLDLGIFYLSFLDEACDKMGIKFESMVNQTQFSGAGQTITTLTFTL
ncbi:MAG: hypothetical protein LBD09_03155 [Treponema sp.]|jgi:hypothetical protein|nr:hypothetical protein [Treponema sp.]